MSEDELLPDLDEWHSSDVVVTDSGSENSPSDSDDGEASVEMALLRLRQRTDNLILANLPRFYECKLFPMAQFGPRLASSFELTFDDTIRKLITLERFCDAEDETAYGITRDSYSNNLPLIEAFNYPERVCKRFPINLENQAYFCNTTIKKIWCRLVAHYFQWCNGIAELFAMPQKDRLALSTYQLCRVICVCCAYYTYKANDPPGMIHFGAGYIYDKEVQGTTTLVARHALSISKIIHEKLLPAFRKFGGLTHEEFLLLKHIVFFNGVSTIRLSEFSRSVISKSINKYTQALVDICEKSLDGDDKRMRAMQKVVHFYSMISHINLVAEIDNDSLSKISLSGEADLNGQLTREIHVLREYNDL